MAISEQFTRLKMLYEAIRDIDIAKEKEPDDLLEQIFHAVRDIDKKDYDEDTTNTIVDALRSAVVKMYDEQLNSINRRVGLSYGSPASVPIPKSVPNSLDLLLEDPSINEKIAGSINNRINNIEPKKIVKDNKIV